MLENFAKDKPGVFEYLNSLHPLGHLGEPLDIAYGILYLVSDESKFVTGSELVIDGGYTSR
jgi:NAD(P)-dependent dehydrogenase (short-subunit alcohol dehydrogenase family)